MACIQQLLFVVARWASRECAAEARARKGRRKAHQQKLPHAFDSRKKLKQRKYQNFGAYASTSPKKFI